MCCVLWSLDNHHVETRTYSWYILNSKLKKVKEERKHCFCWFPRTNPKGWKDCRSYEQSTWLWNIAKCWTEKGVHGVTCTEIYQHIKLEIKCDTFKLNITFLIPTHQNFHIFVIMYQLHQQHHRRIPSSLLWSFLSMEPHHNSEQNNGLPVEIYIFMHRFQT